MSETPPANTSQEMQVSQVETEPSTPLLETDYEAIAAAVMETDRGRWFLQEYARRNRNADTQTVLTAIDKLEKRISDDAMAPKEATSVALLSHDLIDLVGAISQVKKEVAELGGQGDDPDHFNSATIELEAIVEQAEAATSEILEAAEKIQEVAFVLREEGASETQCDIIESKIVDVYTACSFQDLTGQRSNKVVQLVGYVERRIASMMSILGLSDADVSDAPKAQSSSNTPSGSAPGLTPDQRNDERPDADLLNGPAISGEGNEQGDVDALFDNAAFDQAPELDGDAFGTPETDVLTPEADDEARETSSFDHPDVSQDSSSSLAEEEFTAQSDDEASLAVEPADASPNDSDELNAESRSLEEQAAEVGSELLERTDDASPAPKADFGEDDESANTPEAADVFGFDVYGDAQLVELHDAEILSQPAETALAESALTTPAQQDIFEIEPLAFGGQNIGSDADTETNGELEAETDGAPKMVVGLPGDFDVDSHVADMFVSSDSETSSESDASRPTDDDENALIDGQDIFEAECVDVDSATPGEEAATEPTDDPEVADAFADAMVIDTNEPSLQSSADEGDAQDPIESNPIDGSADIFDEDVVDDAFAALEADAALEAEQASEELTEEATDLAMAPEAELTPDDPEQQQAQPIEDKDLDLGGESNAAEELMEQALAATMTPAEEAEYPDDEYTAEERIALFS